MSALEGIADELAQAVHALGHKRTFHTLIRHVRFFGRHQTSRRDRLNVCLVPKADISISPKDR